MNFLKLKIPPPLVALVTAAGMWLAARAVPGLEFAFPANRAVAGGIAVVGLVISLLAVLKFRRARTTLNPLQPAKASSLITTGIFKLTRNPMYLGVLLLLLGWAIWLSNVLALCLPVLFVLYMNHFQIRPEEAALARLFGQQFVEYKAKVRRWI